MDEQIVQQIVDELLSSLEPLETQNAALLQFLKAKGIATDEELAPFLEQAANTANVRWRAVRVRTAALISSAMKPVEKPAETTPVKNAQAAQATSEERKQSPAAEKEEKNENEVGKAETEQVKHRSEDGARKEDAARKEDGARKEDAARIEDGARKEDGAKKDTLPTSSQPSQQTQEDSKPVQPESSTPELKEDPGKKAA